jgi:hypothetical protein
VLFSYGASRHVCTTRLAFDCDTSAGTAALFAILGFLRAGKLPVALTAQDAMQILMAETTLSERRPGFRLTHRGGSNPKGTARQRHCAKDISSKYINPPHILEFAILFIPTESLYEKPALAEQSTTLDCSSCRGGAGGGFGRSCAISRKSFGRWVTLSEIRRR